MLDLYITIRIAILICVMILSACTMIPVSINGIKEEAQPVKVIQVFPRTPFAHEASQGFNGRYSHVRFEVPDGITLVIENIALTTAVLSSGNKVVSVQLRMEYPNGSTIYHPFPIPNNLVMDNNPNPSFSNRWETRLYAPASSTMVFLINTEKDNSSYGLTAIAHIIISGYEVPANSPSLAP